MTKDTPLYVQYGCAFSAPEGWLNFDASPTLRFERIPLLGKFYVKNASRFPEDVIYGDIIRGLPVRQASCAGVYASHVLEHLSLKEFRTALKNTLHVLSPGGIFRLVVPDLEFCAKAYIESSEPDAAGKFMAATSLGVEERPSGLSGFFKSWLGNSRHLWMWDFKSLERELIAAGFTDIRRAAFGDSSDRMFARVEEKDRFVDAVAVECRKHA